MVKKLKKMAEQKAASPAGLLDSQLAGAVKASAQQIWLAGMGAFAKAQEEGGKVFEALVKEGVGLQRKTQAVAEERLGDVTGKMSAMAGEVTNKAGASWDKLESIFEARTAKAMGKLGVHPGRQLGHVHGQAGRAHRQGRGRADGPGGRPGHRRRQAGRPTCSRQEGCSGTQGSRSDQGSSTDKGSRRAQAGCQEGGGPGQAQRGRQEDGQRPQGLSTVRAPA